MHRFPLLCLLALSLTLTAVSSARRTKTAVRSARRTNPLVVFPPRPERLRAMRYATCDGTRCLWELSLRGVDFVPAAPARGIDTPIVLGKFVRGVEFVPIHAAKRARIPLMDCRLALALDDLATIAADHGIARIHYSSIHRPGRRSRGHGAGTAIDINEFIHKDGSVLNVLNDFAGAQIGSRTCGNGAPAPAAAKAVELRELVCAIDDANSFNLLLTPHYDRRHQNHFHLEVRRGIKWFLTQ
jgi:hypothetical protein